jgi:hypothetical protein
MQVPYSVLESARELFDNRAFIADWQQASSRLPLS